MQWFNTLDVWAQALLASLMMYAMTAFGALFVFFSKKINQTLLTALTGLAAGIMIAASFFSLLLPAIEHEGSVPAYITVTVGFALGGAFIVLSDLALSRSKLSFRAIGDKKNALLFLAVTLHNIPEGMSVGVAFAVSASATAASGGVLSAFLLAVGIAVQNFPEGMCVAFPLKGHEPFAKFSFFPRFGRDRNSRLYPWRACGDGDRRRASLGARLFRGRNDRGRLFRTHSRMFCGQ